ncbi:MAG: hypothetical protein H0T73_10755 [Ardenticatenales bacterium]|nr:hypothetical protein [Ardenticatenales bacterium]
MMALQILGSALFPVWLPILVAPLVYLLRRHSLVAALLSSMVVAMAAWWLVNFPPQDIVLLGRPLFLSGMAQALLVGLAAWLVMAFLFSWRISQGWTLFPFLLMVYGLLVAAMLFEELVIQVLLLKAAWLVVIMLVQGGAAANTRAATRLLILSVLALPPFLVASTLIAQRLYEPEAAALTAFIVLTLGMGFALMLAIIPFHAWLPQAAEDGPPIIAAWLAAGMGGSYLVLLFDLLAQYRWLAENMQVQRLLFGGGILMAITGGVLAVTERHLGRLWAYTVLADLGYILLALSFGTRAGTLAALLVIGSRLISLLLAGSALATIRHRATTLDFDDLLGVGARLPISMLGFAIGGMAMLGAPLTAGFPGHWSVLRLLMEQGSGWVWVLIIASVLGLVGFIRAFAVMTAPVAESKMTRVEGEPRIASTFLFVLGILSVLMGLAPQTLDPILNPLLRSLNF